MKKESRIKLIDNAEELRKFKDTLLSKAHAQRVLAGYASQFIPIDESTFFEGDIKLNFVEAFKIRYASDFPSYLAIEKIMELVDFSLEKFQFLLDKYKFYDIEKYDPINQQAPIPDFAIYAKSPEEIERYNLSKNLVDTLNAVAHKITPGLTTREAISLHIQPITYNRFNDTFEINIKYILGK